MKIITFFLCIIPSYAFALVLGGGGASRTPEQNLAMEKIVSDLGVFMFKLIAVLIVGYVILFSIAAIRHLISKFKKR